MLILLVIVDSDHNHIITTLALHNCPTRRLNKTYIYVGHVIADSDYPFGIIKLFLFQGIGLYEIYDGNILKITLHIPVIKGRYPYMFAMAIIYLMFSERYVCYLPVIKGRYPYMFAMVIICFMFSERYVCLRSQRHRSTKQQIHMDIIL
jgi:hypothetical protein